MSFKHYSSDPETERSVKGEYQLQIMGTTFEPDSDINVEFVFHGQVYGLAGTDQARRDLVVAVVVGGAGCAGVRVDRLAWHIRADHGHCRGRDLVRRLGG